MPSALAILAPSAITAMVKATCLVAARASSPSRPGAVVPSAGARLRRLSRPMAWPAAAPSSAPSGPPSAIRPAAPPRIAPKMLMNGVRPRSVPRRFARARIGRSTATRQRTCVACCLRIPPFSGKETPSTPFVAVTAIPSGDGDAGDSGLRTAQRQDRAHGDRQGDAAGGRFGVARRRPADAGGAQQGRGRLWADLADPGGGAGDRTLRSALQRGPGALHDRDHPGACRCAAAAARQHYLHSDGPRPHHAALCGAASGRHLRAEAAARAGGLQLRRGSPGRPAGILHRPHRRHSREGQSGSRPGVADDLRGGSGHPRPAIAGGATCRPSSGPSAATTISSRRSARAC